MKHTPTPPSAAGWLRPIRRYFKFSRRETSGFVGLLLLILLFLALPWLLLPALPRYSPAPDQQELDQLAAELAAQRQVRTFPPRYPRRKYPRYQPVAQVQLAPFDPNTLTAPDWEARGLSHFLAQRVVHFRDVIGGFKAKEQIKRTYGLPDSVYTRLAPYIQLPDQLPPREKKQFAHSYKDGAPAFADRPAGKFPRKPTHLAPFDLNTADTTQLMQIRGIGRGLSRRVVEYRQQLGGFLREDQLAEIYSLRDAPDLVDSLRKYSFVAPGFAPASLEINAAPFEVLQAHPYVGKRLARVIVAFRQQHPPFRQPDDLRQIRILDAETLDKLRPYLRF
ncbi:ComEA family DNA-binding protein [Hymenobacter chitinivorans]|uniref:DNA uptake protein ComE-like DNA-binding protein n=1 Tax=Hymenobacter chitinivorans DSM 11115 TaxID=1121954 RepID=A0A2M9BAA5_9BACT|nr:helix-hairpin-helix domain-containing protein [Hymenobacter chitinivorans]PJJ54869.1 DNA uptake protein ComE-like DNA-binding protein [Hymenobacter chitinivorans DSM 11115]